MKPKTIEGRIVAKIFEDLRDRRTLKHLFAKGDAYEKIDDTVQAEIAAAWRKIIRAELKGGLTPSKSD